MENGPDEPMDDHHHPSVRQENADAGMSYLDRLVAELPSDEGESDEYVPSDPDEESEDEYAYDEELRPSEYIDINDNNLHRSISSLLVYDDYSGDSDYSGIENWDLFDNKVEDMSEAAKGEVAWRKVENFSDWTIEVTSEGGKSEVYHVHRVTLAFGERKCNYFATLFNSGRFQECADKMSRVEVPKDAADAFPAFLDFLYAPLWECNRVITSDNVLPLRFLADYFFVPMLGRAVKEFMVNDITNLERVEKYLLEMKSYDDDSKEIFVRAARVCLQRRREIKVDSSLLFCLPPFVFYRVAQVFRKKNCLSSNDEESDEGKIHICQLALSYIKHHRDRLDQMYFSALANELDFPDDEVQAGLVAYELLKIINETGWEKESSYRHGSPLCLQYRCVDAYSKYLSSDNVDLSSIDFMELLENIPRRAASELLEEAIKSKKELVRELETDMDTSTGTSVEDEADDDDE